MKVSSGRVFFTFLSAVFLCVSSAQGAPIILSAIESGTGLHAAIAKVTGDTYTHTNEPNPYTVPFLAEEVAVFTNRAHEYNGLPYGYYDLATMGFVGAEIVQIANENRDVANYQVTVNTSADAEAYIFMDFRVPQQSWLVSDGWEFLNLAVGIDENGDGVGPGASIQNFYWVWQKSVPAGSFIGRQRGAPTGNNMYGIAVLPAGSGVTDALPFPTIAKNFAMLDIGRGGGRAEPGSNGGQIGVGTTADISGNLPTRSLTSSAPFNAPFTLTLDNVNASGVATGALDWRDRGDAASTGGTSAASIPLLMIAEDHVKNNAGIIRATLGLLPAGTYDVTAFFMDCENSQSEAIKILVDNGDGAGYVDTGVIGSALFPTPPLATAPYNPGTNGENLIFPDLVGGVTAAGRFASTFRFFADGVHDVRIVFDGSLAVDKEVPLSGLAINFVPIPEPSTWALAAIALACGWRVRKRR